MCVCVCVRVYVCPQAREAKKQAEKLEQEKKKVFGHVKPVSSESCVGQWGTSSYAQTFTIPCHCHDKRRHVKQCFVLVCALIGPGQIDFTHAVLKQRCASYVVVSRLRVIVLQS